MSPSSITRWARTPCSRTARTATRAASMSPETCMVCHMEGANGKPNSHLFRINPNPNFYTYPQSASAFYAAATPTGQTSGAGSFVEAMGNFNPSTDTFLAANAPLMVNDGYPASNAFTSGSNAIANDVDTACGQCHGGGSGNGVNPYGITAPYAGIPQFSRTYLATKAASMHNTQAAAPVLSPAPGAVSSGATVTMTQSQNVPIYYTTNGTTRPPRQRSTRARRSRSPAAKRSSPLLSARIPSAPMTSATSVPVWLLEEPTPCLRLCLPRPFLRMAAPMFTRQHRRRSRSVPALVRPSATQSIPATGLPSHPLQPRRVRALHRR